MTVAKRCNNSWIAKLRSSLYIGFQQFLILSYYCFELVDFFFQETQNTQLQERYKDYHSIHPELDSNLWLEVGSFGGYDRNQVYGISNTKAERLRTTRRVSTIGCLQSIPSTISSKFQAILNQQIEAQITHLVIVHGAEIIHRWQMCSPLPPPDLDENQPPSPTPLALLFQMNCI